MVGDRRPRLEVGGQRRDGAAFEQSVPRVASDDRQTNARATVIRLERRAVIAADERSQRARRVTSSRAWGALHRTPISTSAARRRRRRRPGDERHVDDPADARDLDAGEEALSVDELNDLGRDR